MHHLLDLVNNHLFYMDNIMLYFKGLVMLLRSLPAMFLM